MKLNKTVNIQTILDENGDVSISLDSFSPFFTSRNFKKIKFYYLKVNEDKTLSVRFYDKNEKRVPTNAKK